MSELNKVNYNGTLYDIGGSGGTNPVIVQDGVTYTLVVDPNTGDLIAVPEEEEYHIVEDGLIAHYRVVDGVVTDVVSGTTYPEITVYSTDNPMDGNFLKTNFELLSGVKEVTVDFVSNRYYTGDDGGTGRRGIIFATSEYSGRIGVGCSPDNNAPTSNSISNNSIYTMVTERINAGSNIATIHFVSGPFIYTYDGRYNFADSRQTPKVCYFDGGPARRSYRANPEKCTCAVMINANEQQDPEKNKCLAINGILFPNMNNDSNVMFPNSEFSVSMDSRNEARYKEIRIYNRFLTEDEVRQNALADGTYFAACDSFVIGKAMDGFAPFGANYSIGAVDSIIPNVVLDSEVEVGTYEDDFGNEYTISDFTAYTEPSRTESTFEGVKFIFKPDVLYTFRKYSVVAYPFPFTGTFIGNGAEGSYHILYSSSDDSVCECVEGVLIPKSPGTVTITARLAGSQLTDSFTATVEEYDNSVSEAETTYISRKYTYDIHPLVGGSPSDTMIAIRQAIYQAHEEGFKKAVFPKRTYHIYPVFDTGDTLCSVPSNLVIDFNGSTIYIDDNPYAYASTGRAYHLFVFQDVENSSIENLTIYGERLNNTEHAEGDYSSFCSYVHYQNAHFCGTKNIHAHDVVGFGYWLTEDQQYHYYEGIRDPNWIPGSGLANRGRITYQDWELGDYDANGDKITDANHIRTIAKMSIGYEPEDLETFLFGFMGIRYYIIGSRWLRVWWYDSNDVLLNPGGTLYFQYSKYHLPTGAVAFKLSAYGGTLPTQDYGEDYCTLRIYPYRCPNDCYVLDFSTENPGGWGLTITGGQNNYIGNATIGITRKWTLYSIDLEDSFPTMQSYVFDKVISGGINLYGGQGHAIINTSADTNYSINPHTDIEAFRVLNCVCYGLMRLSKTDSVYRGIKYASTNSDTPQGSLIETDNEVISNFNTV